MQPRLGGPDRDAKSRGDIGEGKVKVEVKDQDGPLFERQATQYTTEPITLGDMRREVASCRRCPFVDKLQLDDVPGSTLLRQPVTGANGQAVQPAVPGLRVAKRTNVAPSQHEGFLDRVLGAIRVPQDELGGAIQPGRRGSHQERERLSVSGAGPFHELDLHLATASDATLGAAFKE